MTENLILEPALVAFDHQLVKGALVRIDSQGGSRQSSTGGGNRIAGDMLHFQYNPETITRARTGKWEPRRRRRRASDPASPQEIRGERGGQGSAALMAESETISMKIIFDATEAILAGRNYQGDGDSAVASQGVLPMLAFLEIISLGKQEQESRGRSTQRNSESARPVKPDELLLVLGNERMFPVVMTSLTITEKKFNPALIPIRAEADIKMNVLEPAESAYSRWIRSAFDQLFQKRRHAMSLAAGRRSELQTIANALDPRSGSSGSH
jgi:hypothetical protein